MSYNNPQQPQEARRHFSGVTFLNSGTNIDVTPDHARLVFQSVARTTPKPGRVFIYRSASSLERFQLRLETSFCFYSADVDPPARKVNVKSMRAAALLRSWRGPDHDPEQALVLTCLQTLLDEDRGSARKLFPSG